MRQEFSQALGRAIHAFYVPFLCLLIGSSNGKVRERTYFGNDQDDESDQVSANPGLFTAVSVPLIFGIDLSQAGLEAPEIFAGCVAREVSLVQEGFGVSDMR